MPRVNLKIGELQEHQEILDRIRKALAEQDFSLVVIFPTLSLLQAIRNELLDQPDLKGLGGVRFLLFTGFIEEVLERTGFFFSRPTAEEDGLLVTEAFTLLEQEKKLEYLNRIPLVASYRQALLNGFQEWNRSLLSPRQFREWAMGQGRKERELALLFETYQGLLREKGFADEEAILDHLEKQAVNADQVDPLRVILYGFTDLTPFQQKLVKFLEGHYSFELILDPTRVPEFQELIGSYLQLDLKIPKPVHEVFHKALDQLQHQFGTATTIPQPLKPSDDSVQIIRASGMVCQLTVLAREIKKLLKEHPDWNLTDILIIAPQPEYFSKVAAPLWEEYQLNCRGVRRPVREAPAVSLFAQAMSMAVSDWHWPELELLLRRIYDGHLATDLDRLLLKLEENYGAVSGKSRWLELLAGPTLKELFSRYGLNLDWFQKVVNFIEKFPEQAALWEYLDWAESWFGNDPLKDREAADQGVTLGQHLFNQHASGEVCRILNTLRFRLESAPGWGAGYDRQGFQNFCAEFLLSAEIETGLGLSEAVAVIPPREARGLRKKAVFITGLEQGSFPRPFQNDWKLPFDKRRSLKEIGVELETGAHFDFQEKLAFYWALQSADEYLYLVYQDQDTNGQPQNPSPLLEEIQRCLPELQARVREYPLTPQTPDLLADCFSAFEKRCWAVNRLLQTQEHAEVDLNRETVQIPDYYSLVMRLWQWRAEISASQGDLSSASEITNNLATKYGPEFCFSITALDDYRGCPYRFFLKQILGVKPVRRAAFAPELLDIGELYHRVLEEFGDCYRGQALEEGRLSEYQQNLASIFTTKYRTWLENAPNDLAQAILFVQEALLRQTLERWLRSELEWAERNQGRFRINNVEVSFGSAKSGESTFTKPLFVERDKTVLRIKGRIDRVDTDAQGNFIVYDYKTGRGPKVKEIIALEKLQLPVYLLALEQIKFGKDRAVGGSYLGLRQPSRGGGGIWHQERLTLDWKAKGVLDDTGWNNWLDQVEQGLVIAVRGVRNACFSRGEHCPDYCDYQSVCRRREREVERTDELCAESSPT